MKAKRKPFKKPKHSRPFLLFFLNEKVLELDVFCIILRCSVKYKTIFHNTERDIKIYSPRKIKFPYDNEVRKYYFYWEDTSLYRPHHHAKNI